MPIDQSSHTHRTGTFYDKAVSLSTRKLSFLTKYTVGPFISILFEKIDIALLWFLLPSWTPKLTNQTKPTRNLHPNKHDNNHTIYIKRTCRSTTYKILNTITIILLIILAGDVETNPGPTQFETNSKPMSIIHINTNRIRYKIPQIQLRTKDIDIVTISESWLNPTIRDSEIRLPGFHDPIRKDRDTKGGGVAVYVRENLFLKQRPDLDVKDLEAIWVETKIKNESLLVGSFYRPGSKPVSYWKLIDQSIKNATNTGSKFVILGDFNSDYLENPSKHLLDIISLNKLRQLVTKPTRYTDTSASCIDLILTPMTDTVIDVGVLTPICSDHSVPFIKLNKHIPCTTSSKRTFYNYSKLDSEMLNECLAQKDLNSIVLADDIDKAAEDLSEAIMTCVKKCTPVTTVKLNDRDPPWVNNEIKDMLKLKNMAYNRAKQTNSAGDCDIFRRTRNKYTAAIRKRKIDHDTELDNKISHTSHFSNKSWWKTVSSFLHKNGTEAKTIPPLQSQNGDVVYSARDKAELFNSFFTSQSTVEAKDDPVPTIPRTNLQIPHLTITTNDVFKILTDLDTNKAVGPDLIHNKVLKNCAGVLAPPLTKLFNRSINEGKFPEIWKMANVVPIHKSGDKHLVNNYRPISLLSCVGKVLEACIQKHILNYLIQNNLITAQQSGFLPNHSTIYQLLNIYNDISSAMDKNITTQAVFFDISKAFDKVWHKGLISKLDAIGIRGQLLPWFENYLTNRKQSVLIAGDKSDQRLIEAGVPQGSVLGPTLFLVYINDLVQNIESTVELFADDTSLYLCLEDPHQRAHTLNLDLARIAEWAKKWKVMFNPIKTKLINFSRKLNPTYLPLLFSGQPLSDSSTHKHLGITLQRDGRWDSHIRNLIQKCRTLVTVLKTYKYRLSRKSLEIMYKSFILPHFDYADVVWDNCSAKFSNELEELQLDALRTITGSVRGTSHARLYRESGFPPLKERRRRHKLILYFKMVNNITPASINKHLPPLISDVNPYHRRRPHDRRIPKCRTEQYRSSFFPSTTKLWNSLPIHIQATKSISQFKHFLQSNDITPPPYYYLGDRRIQIIHTKLRLNMSDLNSHLLSRHLTDDPSCACGYHAETPQHYLLHCPIHDATREVTINYLPTDLRTTSILLHGDRNLKIKTNNLVIGTVLSFILMTERFA